MEFERSAKAERLHQLQMEAQQEQFNEITRELKEQRAQLAKTQKSCEEQIEKQKENAQQLKGELLFEKQRTADAERIHQSQIEIERIQHRIQQLEEEQRLQKERAETKRIAVLQYQKESTPKDAVTKPATGVIDGIVTIASVIKTVFRWFY